MPLLLLVVAAAAAVTSTAAFIAGAGGGRGGCFSPASSSFANDGRSSWVQANSRYNRRGRAVGEVAMGKKGPQAGVRGGSTKQTRCVGQAHSCGGVLGWMAIPFPFPPNTHVESKSIVTTTTGACAGAAGIAGRTSCAPWGSCSTRAVSGLV